MTTNNIASFDATVSFDDTDTTELAAELQRALDTLHLQAGETVVAVIGADSEVGLVQRGTGRVRIKDASDWVVFGRTAEELAEQFALCL